MILVSKYKPNYSTTHHLVKQFSVSDVNNIEKLILAWVYMYVRIKKEAFCINYDKVHHWLYVL